MASVSNRPIITSAWEDVCYPVYTTPFTNLVPDYELVATDRQQLVVGEPAGRKPVIFAVQSNEYSIIDNSMLRGVVDRLVTDYKLDIRYTPNGEFAINVIVPGETFKIGKQTDTLSRSLVFNNSYNGKMPFKVQGTVVNTTTVEKHQEARMRISYYRQVCSNGLMGWSDEFMNLDDYLNWLLKGKPKKYKNAKEVKTSFQEAYTYQERIGEESDLALSRKFHHKGLNVAHFEQYLEKVIGQFLSQKNGLTLKVYERMAKQPITNERAEKLLVEAKLPKMLARQAMARMAEEERLLSSESNLWLLYNAANFTLFGAQASLSINDRYRQDEAIFHELATLALTEN